VENAKATEDDDRTHILNSIVGHSDEKLNDVPPTTHDKYVEINNSLRATFASSAASLQRAAKKSDKEWMKIINAMSKGTMRGEMTFNFKSGDTFDGLTAARATQLAAHIPLSIESLIILHANYSSEFWDALIERLKHFHNLKTLDMSAIRVGGDEGGQEVGQRLAKMISTNTTIKTLELVDTELIRADNVEQWGDALMENNTLTELYLGRVKDEMKDQLDTKTKDRTPKLEISGTVLY